MRIDARGTNAGLVGLVDSFLWIPSICLAALLRNDFDLKAVDWLPVFLVGTVVLFVHFLVLRLSGPGRGFTANRVGSFQDVRNDVGASLIAVAPLAVIVVIWGPTLDVARSLVLLALPIYLLGSLSMKALLRILAVNSALASGTKKALIFGAGEVGELVISQIFADGSSEIKPVGFVDDNSQLHGRRVAGLEVLGASSDLPTLFLRYQVEILVIAIPGIDSLRVRFIEEVCSTHGVQTLIVPRISELLNPQFTEVPLRRVELEDLIGRRSVNVASSEIQPYFAGRSVLVTGAGGSIGLELCRQLVELAPQRLIMLDRDETALQHAALEVHNSGLLDSSDLVLADIRDKAAISSAFEAERPDVVLHAAALKHVTTLERFPLEAWKTNVLGTLHVLEASRLAGVQIFINISTDKAASPKSVLGKSKSIAEGLTAWFGERSQGSYASVRFGNVLGSRGSLVPVLTQLIDKGGPVQITHRDATRYFMSIREACQLVLKSATMADSREVFVLDMGTPVKILDVAEKLIASSGKPIEIQFTGLRDGEKLHEILHDESDEIRESSHPLISVLLAQPIGPEELSALARTMITDSGRL